MNKLKCVFVFLLFFLALGKMLDLEAERVVHQLYQRNSDGIIKGLETIEIKNGNKEAIVFLHGFLETPEAFHEVAYDKKWNGAFDIYVPLSPFHGRDLKAASKFNNKIIAEKISKYIKNIASQYERVTIVGFSYGGGLLVRMIKNKMLPDNASFVLYAPAVYIKSNHLWGNVKLWLYALWRNYSNYELLKTGFPVYQSGDMKARAFIEQEKNLRYQVMSALKQMYANDDQNREYISHMDHPFHIIIAEDDNRVSYKDLKRVCDQNKLCTLHTFPSGRHLVHHGEHKDEITKLFFDLANEKTVGEAR